MIKKILIFIVKNITIYILEEYAPKMPAKGICDDDKSILKMLTKT